MGYMPDGPSHEVGPGDLRRLHYFVVLADEMHFGHAAVRLHLAQPALSQQIRRLERDLRLTLFDRTRHHVQLTQAGTLLLVEARRVLEQAQRLRSVAAHISRGDIGKVSVGFVGSGLYGVVPGLLRAVRRDAPDLQLAAQELETGEQIEALVTGALDVGFLRPPIEPTELQSLHVDSEPLIAALPADHPGPASAALQLGELAADTFIAFPRPLGPGYYDLIISACNAAGFSPRIEYEGLHIHTVIGLVGAGLGVALVPAKVQSLKLERVRYEALAGPELLLPLTMAWRRDDPTPAITRFVTIVRRHL